MHHPPPLHSPSFITMTFSTFLSLLLLALPVSLIEAYTVEGSARRLSFCIERSTKSRLLGSFSETQESISASGLIPPVPVVGDYAGISATFDMAGKLIPVPEHLVPPALLEWGQAPSSLETLVSIGSGKRWTATILPEAGCGVDNLQTTRTVESFSGDFSHDDIFAVDHAIYQQKLLVESYFGLELDGDNNKEDDKFRSRLALNLQVQDNQKLQIIGPISVCLERQVDEISSSGTVGMGGGLDGRSVSRWLGALSKMQSFAERDMTGVSWVSSANNDKSMLKVDDATTTTLYLPGNLTLSYRSIDQDYSQLQLEMGQIHAASGLRHVIRRTFQGHELANVERWVEPGEYIINSI